MSSPTTTAIVVAAGRSERMRGTDKIFVPLAGRPLLAWTLAAFQRCDAIDAVVLVASADAFVHASALVREWRFTKVDAVVAGGPHRQASVRAGLDAAPAAGRVVVHDGARPLVTPDLVARTLDAADDTGAALCGLRARDTVKRVEGTRVVETYDRHAIWLAQTPQAFDRALLADAHTRAGVLATDDAALVEALGHEVRMVEGESWNIKVTTPEDLVIAEALLRERFAAPDDMAG